MHLTVKNLGRAALAAALVALVTLVAGCSKPVTIQTIDADNAMPLDGVAIHRHNISLFTLLPTKSKPSETDGEGRTIVGIPSGSTNLTFLRQGFEPTCVGVFRVVPVAAAPADRDGGWSRLLCWDDLSPRIPVVVPMKRLRSEEVSVRVQDSSGAPLAGCEVLSTTFLFLPFPGDEAAWGFPNLQMRLSDPDGHADVLAYSGFRNRISARRKGYQEASAEIQGAPSAAESVTLRMRPLRYRTLKFRIVDEKNRPIEGATVSFGESRNGRPPDPNGFSVTSGKNGITEEVAVPDADPLLLQIRAKGYESRADGPVWRLLEDGGTRRIVMTK